MDAGITSNNKFLYFRSKSLVGKAQRETVQYKRVFGVRSILLEFSLMRRIINCFNAFPRKRGCVKTNNYISDEIIAK
jgi:hypothetical protein